MPQSTERINRLWARELLLGELGSVALVTAGAPDLNLLKGMAAVGSAVKRVAKVALGHADTAGGIFAWKNPEASAITVNRVTLVVATVATGAGTASVGVAANGTTSAANLIDTLDVHTAAGTFDNITDGGTAGKARQAVAAGQFVTASKASGSVAGLVGSAYIEYFVN